MTMSHVKLIGVTQPTLFVEAEGGATDARKTMTAEQLIAYCARVSNPANQGNPDSEKLLKYLVKNKHWSPFEMVHVVMEIKTTRDIARQILRHRSFSFQEFSQRYAEVTEMSPPREARLQDQKNRQNSIEVDNEIMVDRFLHLNTETFDPVYEKVTLKSEWERRQDWVIKIAQQNYAWATNNGIAKEQARVVLPEGLTMSTMYMSGSLRSWIHYCELRMGNGTQKEHREIATECWDIIIEHFPSLKNVLES